MWRRAMKMKQELRGMAYLTYNSFLWAHKVWEEFLMVLLELLQTALLCNTKS